MDSATTADGGGTTARPGDPVVTICQHWCNGTTAHGHDPLISHLLDRAGFLAERYFGERYHRLPYDLPDGAAERMATDATRMLRACHYEVRIDPGLGLDATPEQRATDWNCPIHPDLPALQAS
ncbi:hypothetical protein [Streptacidiphilus sp. MAP5-3]|uniref:hypothetical protein n=1 Tax=unclassified Streptacidiphilus TaxID=2643834 RepID=UPI0035126AFF